MLRISPTNDKNIINKLSNEIFKCDFDGDIAFVLYDGDEPIGLAHIKVKGNTAHFLKLGIKESVRKKRYGDFFTRSMLFHYLNAIEFIEIDYFDSYFYKFGFAKHNTGMKIKADTLVFPSDCHR